MLLLPLLAAAPAACRVVDRQPGQARETAEAARVLGRIAEKYVRLALAVGVHDADFVDAYYGDEEWREEAKEERKPLEAIGREAAPLLGELEQMDLSGEEEIIRLRRDSLHGQIAALATRVEILGGRKMTFDEESKALYDAVAPACPDSRFEEALARLDRILPGEGPLIGRFEAFRKQFIVPRDRLKAVFDAAIQEARRRTRAHIELPPGESFTVEYVTGKSWGAYNWYKGGARSVIQVNTDLPISVDRAVDLAAHEGYPGHHVYNALLEQRLVRERGWVEFTVYPLFSPQSLIAEGSATFGIEVAFPGDDEAAFERDVLFPLAGLDPKQAPAYHEILGLMASLEEAGTEAGRRYLDGGMTGEETARWLSRFGMLPPDRAEKRVRFMDQYRSYVINYALGKQLVRDYIEKRGGTADRPEKRWEEFAKLLSSPRLPSQLR